MVLTRQTRATESTAEGRVYSVSQVAGSRALAASSTFGLMTPNIASDPSVPSAMKPRRHTSFVGLATARWPHLAACHQ